MTKKLTPFRDTRVCACGDHGFTGLTRGHVAICDPEDVEALSGRLWCLEGAWPRRYAMNGATAERYAHRLIGKPESGQLAARAYDEAAVRLHGEFACTNAMLGLLDASRPADRGRE